MLRTVWITSPEPTATKLMRLLRERGMEAWVMPLLGYSAPSDHYQKLDSAIANLSECQWVVFTSSHAVMEFHARLRHHGSVAVSHLKFAVVGLSTAKTCAEYGFTVHVIPSMSQGEALAKTLSLQCEGRVLFPQAEEGRPELVTELQKSGVDVDVVSAYRTVPLKVEIPTWKKRAEAENWQGLVVTSPKGLKTWLDYFGHVWCHDAMHHRTLYGMGPTTASVAENLGFSHILTPTAATLDSLADLISK